MFRSFKDKGFFLNENQIKKIPAYSISLQEEVLQQGINFKLADLINLAMYRGFKYIFFDENICDARQRQSQKARN